MDEIIDEILEQIAQAFCEAAVDLVYSLPVNAGQNTLVSQVIPDFDQVDNLKEGTFDPVESHHPEAVGEIMDAGNAVLEQGAFVCLLTRLALEAVFSL